METSKKENCCIIMVEALEYSRKRGMKLRQREPLPGLMQSFMFSRGGEHKGDPIIYAVPAIGRGNERTKALNVIINYCPFCGTRLQKAKAIYPSESQSVQPSDG